MKDFVVNFSNKESVATFLDKIGSLDGEWIFNCKRKTHKRSLNQNSYYFGVILPYIAEETGITVMELHLLFRDNLVEWVKMLDEDYHISTADMNTIEFSDYTELIRVFARDILHVDIPDPYSVIR